MSRFVRASRSTGVALCAGAIMFALALAAAAFRQGSGGVASVWLANAVLVAWLVRRPRRQWPAPMVAIFLGNLAAGLFVGDSPVLAASLAGCNAAEIALVAWLLARSLVPDEPFHSLDQIGRLASYAVAGPVASSLLLAALLVGLGLPLTPELLFHRLLANALGILVVAPLLLALSGPRPTGVATSRLEFLLLLGIGALASHWVFSQSASSLFLVTPLLVFAALRLRLDQATVLVVLVCAIALVQTLAGEGPLHSAPIDPSMRIFLLKAFMATVVTLVLPVAALSQDRARTAAALRSSEEHYRLLADNSSDLVLRLDAGGSAHFVSSAARRLLGLTEQALAGDGFAAAIHDDDLPRFRSALDRVRRNGASVTCFRMRTRRGEYRWIEAHCRLAGTEDCDTNSCGAAAAGQCRGGARAPCSDGLEDGADARSISAADVAIVATLRDVHQRRTAEIEAAQSAARLREGNRLLLMAENLASLGHGLHDPDSGEILLSAEAATLVGLAQLTLSPRELVDLVHPEDRRDLLRGVALARGHDVAAECIIRIVRQGSERTLQIRLQRRDPIGGSLALFGVVSDITDKLMSQRRLVEALEEARAAAEFRSQFLATMSHEIRTPMTGVVGMIELLADEPPAAKRRLYLDTLRHSADLLMTVVNDILDFSKVDAGQLLFADEPFDLGRLLGTTLRLFERPAAKRGLTLVLDSPAPDQLWLRGDPQRLQQVLSNLLSNAIKFSEQGDVTLRCSAQPRPGARMALRLDVEDRGIGITKALASRLFEPFVQGEERSRGGTGLGLAISRRLVTGMGGSLTLRPSREGGSIFTVELQLELASPAQAARPALAAPEGTRPLDILLAEDNPVNQMLVTALLKRLGHRVTCVADGQAALETATARRFDCILMDMQMPRLDGRSAAAAIRAGGLNEATPILALTADAAGRDRPAEEQAIDAVLTKPIDSQALAEALVLWTSPRSEPALLERKGAIASPGSSQPLDTATLGDMEAALGPERLDDLLDLLAAELEARPRALRAALADRDWDLAAAEAHSLKGAAANLGATLVAAAAAGLEQAIGAAKAGQAAPMAPALRTLAAAVTETQHALAILPRTAPLLVAQA